MSSVWPRVERRLASVGVQFDLWQQGFAMAALGCREDGKYAATVGGIVESIPRQVGKTYKDGNIAIGLAAEFPGLRVAWTSHHLRTTTNTFRKMQGLVTRPKMKGLLAPNGIRLANGEQEIKFANGSIIMFGARSEGFGRGMDELDILFFDEAQILGLKALEDMVPATNQAKHPHGGLVFLLGTPPRPTDDGEAFTAMRRAALSGESKSRMYVELSADPDAAWDDRAQWRKMNPSYPHRTPEEAMLRMRELIPGEDAWRREAMGIWDDDGSAAPWHLFPKQAWTACATTEEGDEPGWIADPTYAVEVDPQTRKVAVGAAGVCREGGIGLQIVAIGGADWNLAAWLTERGIGSVVIDDGDGRPAAPLAPLLRNHGLEVQSATFGDLKVGTSGLFDGVLSGSDRHRNNPELDTAVAHGTRRKSGDVWLVDRYGPGWMVNAVILARWGHLQPAPLTSFAMILGGSE